MDESGTLIFGDLETGGLNPKRHPIIQLAAIAVDGESLTTLKTIEIKIAFDEARANKHAIRKNSYDRLSWRNEALDDREAAFTIPEGGHAPRSKCRQRGLVCRPLLRAAPIGFGTGMHSRSIISVQCKPHCDRIVRSMTLTLQIPMELEARLREQAKAEGKPPEDLALEALQDKLASSDGSSVMLPRAIWKQEFEALLASMPNGNVEADLSRASVYEGRGE